MKYIIQKVKSGNKKMVLIFDAKEGILEATKEYRFNIDDEVIEPLNVSDNIMILEELEITSKEYNHYKKCDNLI